MALSCFEGLEKINSVCHNWNIQHNGGFTMQPKEQTEVKEFEFLYPGDIWQALFGESDMKNIIIDNQLFL